MGDDDAGAARRRGTKLIVSAIDVALQNCSNQYEDYYKSFSGLDAKAQNAATVAGVLLGSIVAFLNAGKVGEITENYESFGVFMVMAPAFFAIVTIVFSFIAAKVTEVVVPFAVNNTINEAKDLAGIGPDAVTDVHLINYYRGIFDHWQSALTSIGNSVNRKAKYVWRGQVALFFAIFSLFVLLVVFATTPCP